MATNNTNFTPFHIKRILAQLRPSGTGAVTAYTKPTAIALVTIYNIVVCNTTGSGVNYSIYIDNDGTTYDQTTAVAYSSPIAPNETQCLEFEFTLDTLAGTIGIQSSTGSALTFTITGKPKEYN